MKAVIFGLAGTRLSNEERAFFEETQPLGFILFKRNCESAEQIRTLVADLRATSDRLDVPILIDQEGGRVCRLRPPEFRAIPPAKVFGDLYEGYPVEALELAFQNHKFIGQELLSVGVNTNCAPCADLRYAFADKIIGDRAFSDQIDIVADFSVLAIKAHIAAGVMPIIKHIPGHGRAMADSHLKLPIVNTATDELKATDFKVFRSVFDKLTKEQINHPWAMTAHVAYSAFDGDRPATESPLIIQDIIRNYVGFNGFLVSDCVTMQALSGTYAERAERSIKAGCDAVLFCNGVLDDMRDVAKAVSELTGESLDRYRRSGNFGGAVPLPDSFLQESHDWAKRMADHGVQWQSQVSTIGEKII